MCRACFQNPVNLASKTRRTRSPWVSCGRFTCRLSTINCCRSMAFSTIGSFRQRFRSESDPTVTATVVGLVRCLMCCFMSMKSWFQKRLIALIMLVGSTWLRKRRGHITPYESCLAFGSGCHRHARQRRAYGQRTARKMAKNGYNEIVKSHKIGERIMSSLRYTCYLNLSCKKTRSEIL